MRALGHTAELFGVYGQYHATIFVSNMANFLQYLGLKLFHTNDTQFKYVRQLFRIVDYNNA